MKYSICEETGLRVCEIFTSLLVREDGMVRNISGNPHTKGNWTTGSKVGAGARGGYYAIRIPSSSGKFGRVSQLVATAFIPLITGCPIVDHIDGVVTNNNIDNLRWVSIRGNSCNRKTHRAGRLVGANFHKSANKWRSLITINGKQIHLGYFNTEQSAHEAYLEARIKYEV